MHTDLWAGLNCHVTFLVVVSVVACLTGAGAGCADRATPGDAAMLVVTPVLFLALPLLFRSCSVKSSLSTSASVVSPNKSHPGSAGSRLGRAAATDLVPAAETLEERLGSESDRSESQSLSPATEPQPSNDRSTGPEPELSESESLGKDDKT